MHICQCNHLTSLTILFPFHMDKETEHDQVLSVISVIGCAVSMISLALVLATFVLFPKWRKTLGNKILFNLSAALFLLLASFLSAAQLTHDPRRCKMNAVATHYFLLVSFAWMFVEAVYQYLVYVRVFGARSYITRFMWKAVPLTWGLSFIPVLSLVIYDSELYLNNSRYCWMAPVAFYPTVLVPVSIILLANLVLYFVIFKNAICVKNTVRSNISDSVRFWSQLRMALCVFFLLGLGWTFAFLSIGDARIVFSYLFCIFTSLQGFVIFVFFVLRGRESQHLWSAFLTLCRGTGTRRS